MLKLKRPVGIWLKTLLSLLFLVNCQVPLGLMSKKRGVGGGALWDWLDIEEMVVVDWVAIKIAGFMRIEPRKKYFSCSKIQRRQKEGRFLDTLSVKETSHATATKSWQWQGEVAKNYFPSLSRCFSFLRETETLGQILGEFSPHPVLGILWLRLEYLEQQMEKLEGNNDWSRGWWCQIWQKVVTSQREWRQKLCIVAL